MVVLMIVPLPLVIYGVFEGVTAAWVTGVVLATVGGPIPPITHYAFDGDGEGGDDDGTDELDDVAEGQRGPTKRDRGSLS